MAQSPIRSKQSQAVPKRFPRVPREVEQPFVAHPICTSQPLLLGEPAAPLSLAGTAEALLPKHFIRERERQWSFIDLWRKAETRWGQAEATRGLVGDIKKP